MKKVFLILLVSTITFICTGCVKFDYNIEINKDNKINISQTQGFNVKFFRAISPGFDNGFKKSVDVLTDRYDKLGYETSLYEDDAFSGLTIARNGLTFKQAKEFLPSGFSGDENSFTVSKGLVKNSYRVHLYYDIKEALKNPDIVSAQRENPTTVIMSPDRESQYINGQLVDMTAIRDNYAAIEGEKPSVVPVSTLKIKIPAKAKSSNATKVINDNEYQWDLSSKDKPVEIILEYETVDFSKLGVALSLILLLGAVFYMVAKVQKGDVVKGL